LGKFHEAKFFLGNMVQDAGPSGFDYDLIIVGGGPAGVLCAITVAMKGHSVVIVDKKEFKQIGDKTCGDAIDKAALQRIHKKIGLEFPKDNEVSDEILTMSIAAGDVGTKISLTAPGYVLDRHIYGQRLLQQAIDVGVEVIDSAPVRNIIIEKINGTSYLQGIEYIKGNQKNAIKAKFTIDASGAYAVIRKQLPTSFLEDGITVQLTDNELWPTYREIIELDSDLPDHKFRNEIILLYKNDFPPPGYFWIFTKGKRKLNCGIGWLKNQSNELGGLKQAYLREMENYFPRTSYRVIKTGGGQIPVRPPFDSLVFNGGALVGDAACMVHPVTAEGHGPALDTAMHLGITIAKALEGDDREKIALWSYNKAIAEHYGLKHMQALIMRKFLIKVGVKNIQYLIKKGIFKKEEMDLIFSGGELSLSFRTILHRVSKLIFKPKLLMWLRSLFREMERCEEIYETYPTHPNDLAVWRELRNKKLGMKY
jgi:digeranylgeranylglycerophospholipid reductase